MLPALSPEHILIITAIFIALSLGAIAVIIRATIKTNQIMSRRLAGAPGEGARVKKPAVSKNMIAQFGQHLTLPGPEEITKIRFKLSQAGFYTSKAIPVYYGVRMASLLLPLFLFITYWVVWAPELAQKNLIIISIVLILFGLLAPGFVLGRRIERRKQQARNGFPDMMDLLLACIEAGLGLDAALSNVAKELGTRFPVIQINLDLLNLELMAGRSRPEAFKNFAERLGLEEAGALNIMLKQSEDMGSSLGTALRTFSNEMRAKRMLLAEEKAMSLPAKMTVPLILFIFPTILLMLFLPAGARLSGAFL